MGCPERCPDARPVHADLLAEVRKREQVLGVEVDWSVDAMLSAEALPGAQQSVATEFIIHMLGLDICANTIIGNAMHRGISGGQKKRVTSGDPLWSVVTPMGAHSGTGCQAPLQAVQAAFAMQFWCR